MTTDDSPLIQTDAGIGRITLNRPHSMNALDRRIIAGIDEALTAWENQVDVRLVLIDHLGDKAFCAGGDVMLLARSAKADCRAAEEYFDAQNRMIVRLAEYRKPTVSVMNGIVLGGGVGISMACRHRIGTERFSIGFGETSVGLIPDVGATRLLKRIPTALGAWLILTGHRVKAADALQLGFLDYFVPQTKLTDLYTSLKAPEARIEAIFAAVGALPEDASQLPPADLGTCFHAETIAGVLACLENQRSEAADRAARVIREKSPAAGNRALTLLHTAPSGLSQREAVALEFAAQRDMLRHGDFVEWARAFLIDKDNSPNWASAN